MQLDDAELAELRAFIKRVRASIFGPAPRAKSNAERARAWRTRRRGGAPARQYTDWGKARACARAGHPLTAANVRYERNGQPFCLACHSERTRTYRKRRRRAACATGLSRVTECR